LLAPRFSVRKDSISFATESRRDGAKKSFSKEPRKYPKTISAVAENNHHLAHNRNRVAILSVDLSQDRYPLPPYLVVPNRMVYLGNENLADIVAHYSEAKPPLARKNIVP